VTISPPDQRPAPHVAHHQLHPELLCSHQVSITPSFEPGSHPKVDATVSPQRPIRQ
jgi:hypothetical protein